MFLISVFIIFIIFLILIYTIIRYVDFAYKNILILSSTLGFILAHLLYFNSLGYPVTDNLPAKFRLLYSYKNNDHLYILVNDINNSLDPRLYRFKYSTELEKILDDALGEARRGIPMIGIYNSSNLDNSHGIKFDKMRRELPSK
tara:strand:- start:12 stop:443 length:432 start_codon:yes stop_codon:yes gene_type:complete